MKSINSDLVRRTAIKLLGSAFALLSLTAGEAWALNADLEAVLSRIDQKAKSSGQKPFVVSDLDETLIDSMARKFYSYRIAVQATCATISASICESLMDWNLNAFYDLPNRYDYSPLWIGSGVTDSDLKKKIADQAFAIYSSPQFMSLDQSVPGAVEFISRLRKMSVEIYFATARDQDSLFDSTAKSLKALGMLPEGQADHILLKQKGQSSLEFKQKAFSAVKDLASSNQGFVVLAMENEPENMNLMIDAYPDAEKVFVDGAFIKDMALKGSVIHVKDFR